MQQPTNIEVHSVELSVYFEKLLCYKCKKEMKCNPVVLMSNPPKYQYYCETEGCNNKYTSITKYPRTAYKEKVT